MSFALKSEGTSSETGDRNQHVGIVTGSLALLLRLEAGVVLIGTTVAYHELGEGWLKFALLFLVPDLSMLGYLRNRRMGAAMYNVGHSYLSPALFALTCFVFGWSNTLGIALIWAAHIGFDRLLGYGLKYDYAFGATHLGWRGRR